MSELYWFTNEMFQKFANHRGHKVSEDELNSILVPINARPHVEQIAETRRQFVRQGATEVFTKWRFHKNGKHVYTYNKGGRSELQANIGIFPEGIRLGYGFNLSGAAFGDRYKASKFLEITVELLKDLSSSTYRIWKSLSPVYAEVLVQKTKFWDPTDIEFQDLPKWLSTEDALWLFFGRFVGIETGINTPSILEQKSTLDYIDEFFASTLSFYEEVWREFQKRNR